MDERPMQGDLTRVVIASNNGHKIQEIEAVLSTVWPDLTLLPQGDLVAGEADETGSTFVENAIIKARFACAATGLPAIADDSGLSVPALGGEPGVYSSRYAGLGATDDDNNRKLRAALEDLPESRRTARFNCVIVLMTHALDPTPVIAEGHLDGVLLTTPRGSNGFGYDPLFFVPEMGATVAELGAEVKNTISHRARALAALRERL